VGGFWLRPGGDADAGTRAPGHPDDMHARQRLSFWGSARGLGGLFPSYRSLEISLEGRRRLAYVGITRQERLFLHAAERAVGAAGGGVRRCFPSELPPGDPGQNPRAVGVIRGAAAGSLTRVDSETANGWPQVASRARPCVRRVRRPDWRLA